MGGHERNKFEMGALKCDRVMGRHERNKFEMRALKCDRLMGGHERNKFEMGALKCDRVMRGHERNKFEMGALKCDRVMGRHERRICDSGKYHKMIFAELQTAIINILTCYFHQSSENHNAFVLPTSWLLTLPYCLSFRISSCIYYFL
jgi:hypothetical protein